MKAPHQNMRTGLMNKGRSAGLGLSMLVAGLSATSIGPCNRLYADEAVGPVDVVMLDGPPRSGRIILLDSERVILETPPDGEVTLSRDKVLFIRYSTAPEPDAPRTSWLLFANGDRASLDATTIEDEALIGRWRSYPMWKPLRVPLETASGMIVNPPDSRDAMRNLLHELSRGSFESDVLLLKNRDRLSGELQQVSPEHYELNTPVGPVQAATSQVQALAFNSSLISFPEIAGETVLIILTDGSWLTLVDVRLDSTGILSGETAFGAPVAFPSSSIESLTLNGSRICFLSSLPPAEYRTQPYLSAAVSSPPSLNRNIRGGYQSLRGRGFPRGVGVTSASRTTYSLDRAYQSFRATIGIDDEADGGGSVRFAVEADGRLLFSSGLVTGRDAPIDVGPLDIHDTAELTLIVEYGEYGDILDIADWGNAVLVRPPE